MIFGPELYQARIYQPAYSTVSSYPAVVEHITVHPHRFYRSLETRPLPSGRVSQLRAVQSEDICAQLD